MGVLGILIVLGLLQSTGINDNNDNSTLLKNKDSHTDSLTGRVEKPQNPDLLNKDTGVYIFSDKKEYFIGENITFGILNAGNSEVYFPLEIPYHMEIHKNGTWYHISNAVSGSRYSGIAPKERRLYFWNTSNNPDFPILNEDGEPIIRITEGTYRIVFETEICGLPYDLPLNIELKEGKTSPRFSPRNDTDIKSHDHDSNTAYYSEALFNRTVPQGTELVSEFLIHPDYNKEITLYGRALMYPTYQCSCFDLASGHEKMRVWIGNLQKIASKLATLENGDILKVTGKFEPNKYGDPKFIISDIERI